MVHDGVAHGLDFVFGEVDKEGSTSNHEADESHDPVLVVLLIHEIGFVLGVLFNFLITQSSNIDSQFLMQSGKKWFFELTETDIVIHNSLVLFRLVGLSTVKNTDSGLVRKLAGDVLKFV